MALQAMLKRDTGLDLDSSKLSHRAQASYAPHLSTEMETMMPNFDNAFNLSKGPFDNVSSYCILMDFLNITTWQFN